MINLIGEVQIPIKVCIQKLLKSANYLRIKYIYIFLCTVWIKGLGLGVNIYGLLVFKRLNLFLAPPMSILGINYGKVTGDVLQCSIKIRIINN